MLRPKDNNSAGVFTVNTLGRIIHISGARGKPSTHCRRLQRLLEKVIIKATRKSIPVCSTPGPYPVFRGFAGFEATLWHPTCTRSAAPMTAFGKFVRCHRHRVNQSHKDEKFHDRHATHCVYTPVFTTVAAQSSERPSLAHGQGLIRNSAVAPRLTTYHFRKT